MNVKFEATRSVLESIKSRRYNAQPKRNRKTKKSLQGGHGRNRRERRAERFQKDSRQNKGFRKWTREGNCGDSSAGAFPIVKSEKFSVVTKPEFYRCVRALKFEEEGGVVHNYEDSNALKITPPHVTYGFGDHGPYVDIVGTESLAPLIVLTNNDPAGNGAQTGDVLFTLPIAPIFLVNTRVKLLMQNYDRFYIESLRVRYQPLGSSLLSGGLVMVPLVDPKDTLSSSADPNSKVQRAMDYQNAVSFNVYNSAHVSFPPLPPDEEPFYIAQGDDARFEVPYVLQVLAQTSYAPEPDTPDVYERNLGWLTMEYHIRLYDAILPELSDTLTTIEGPFTGLLYDAVFDFQAAGGPNFAGEAVNFRKSWFVPGGFDENAVVFILQVIATPTLANDRINMVNSDGILTMARGQVYFVRFDPGDSVENTVGRLFSNLASCYNLTDQLTFADNSIQGKIFGSGLVRLVGYSNF